MAGPLGTAAVIAAARAGGVGQNVVWAPTTPLKAVALIAAVAPLVIAGACIVRYPAPEPDGTRRGKAMLDETSRAEVRTARRAPGQPAGPLFRVAAFLFGPLLLGYGAIYGGVYAVCGIVEPASWFADAWGGPTVLGAEVVHEAGLAGMALLGWFLLRRAVRGRRRPTNI